MIAFARLLIQDRWRNLNQHYGWVQYGSAGLMFFIFGLVGAAWAAPYVRRAVPSRLEAWTGVLWAGWTLSAAVTGRDLSWRIGLERIRAFPALGFRRIYFLTFVLGFLSFPLLIMSGVIPYWVWLKGGSRFVDIFAAFFGYGLFVSSVRLSGSLARSILHSGDNLSSWHKQAAVLLVSICAALTTISFLRPEIEVLHPGRLFVQFISGKARVYPLAGMSIWVLLLMLADFVVKRDLTYSRLQWTVPGFRLANFSSMLSLYPLRPGPVFRIGILGWLRSRAAFLLFLWGGGYSVLWTCFSKSSNASYFFLFAFMNLVFHCYLRGNLLGIDRGAAWLYYRSPIRIEKILSSKSLSLSILQGCMIAALFAAGFFRASIRPLDWLALFSYAISAIVLGEICGFFFSILYPESIDRTSQFDGGATVGNIASGALQFLFMILFMRVYHSARNSGSFGSYCGLFLAMPLCLCMIRSVVLKTWVHKAMWAKREVILKKLMWF